MAQARETVRPTTLKRSRTKAETAQTATTSQVVVVHSGKNVAEVPVSKARFKRIATKKGALGRLIAGYADTAAKAELTGQTFLVTYSVTPDGTAEAVSEAPAEEATGGPLDAAIARAKARGATKVADILKGADMLTAREFGPLIGASHETVNAKRKRDEVLGLEGATRGVKYPSWQVTNAGLPLPGLARLFAVLGEQPWTVFRFLLTAHAELSGRTALDAMKSGQVDAVVEVADNLTTGTFS